MKVLNESATIDIFKNLSRADAKGLLDFLHQKLADYSKEANLSEHELSTQQNIYQPLRTNITTRNRDTTLVMPASDTHTTCVKVLTAPQTGNLTAMLSLFDPEGTPLGIVSGTTLTPFRTALTVMILFTKYTGPKRKLLFIGAGRQVEWHIRLALLLHDQDEISEIVIANRTEGNAAKLSSALGNEHARVKFSSCSISQIGADLLSSTHGIFACTPSREPLFAFECLNSSSHYFISLIGSYIPQMHEIDEPTLLSGLRNGARIYVDSKSACLEESGELIDAKIGADQLVEIGELASDYRVDVPEEGNIILKAVGMGIMDLVIGKALLELAAKTNKGSEIEW